MVSATFAPTADAVGAARRFVRDAVLGWGLDALLDEAVLVVSELVTNAVVHAGTSTEVVCSIEDGSLRVDVVDSYPSRWVPVPAGPDTDQESGRGLLLLARLAEAWGVEYGGVTKRVWFRLRPPGGAEAAPLPVQRHAPRNSSAAGLPQPGPTITDDAEGVDPGPDSGPLGRLGLDDLLQLTTARVRDELGCDVAYALLLDEGEVELRGGSGLPDGLPRRAPMPPAEGVQGRVVLGRLPVVLDDADAPAVAPVLAGAGLRSHLTVPLLAAGELLGVLGVAARARGRFTEADAVALHRLADEAALPVHRARLAELEQVRRGWLGFLAEASELLGGTLDTEMTLALVGQLMVPRLGSWCAVAVHGDWPGFPSRWQAVWHADESRIEGLRRALEELPALRREEVSPRPLPAPVAAFCTDPAHERPDRSLFLPLVARGRQLGTLVLGTPDTAPFRPDVPGVAEDLARRAALALDNAQLYQDQVATSRTLQRSLLPPEVPDVPWVEIGVVYQPSGRSTEVGGDFYDVFALGADGWGFAIGDVCGKGAEAAAVTGLARHALRLLTREGLAPALVLERLNAAIIDEGERARFLTVVLGTIRARPGGGARLTLVSAGHPLPLRLRAEGGVEALGEPQPLLGVLDEVRYSAYEVELAPGDLLLAVTDGVTERRDDSGRLLGEDGLTRLLAGCGGLSAQAVAGRLREQILALGEEAPRDDLAVLALRGR